MTDEQIVKALEECNIRTNICTENCPFYQYRYKDCTERKAKETINLLTRKKGE